MAHHPARAASSAARHVLRRARQKQRPGKIQLRDDLGRRDPVAFVEVDRLGQPTHRILGPALKHRQKPESAARRSPRAKRRAPDPGRGFVGAAYRHRLSRAGDPQLHTHVVVANMTRAEGRWTSLDGHALYEHKLAAGAVYRAVLRAEVRERLPWVAWRLVGRGLFEIDGVPAGVLREFSRRRVEIEQRALELTGAPASGLSRDRLEGIALATRRAKDYIHAPAAARRLLNEQARTRLQRDGTLAIEGVVIAGREFCVGERVIARRTTATATSTTELARP